MRILCSAIMLLCIIHGYGQMTNELDTFFANKFSEDAPGGTVLIQKGDRILYSKSMGIADLETAEKIDQHTIMNTGSISKTMVAYGILILAEQGKLSIEDPIGMYFPGFKNKDIAEQVKIKHLLSHTSGLPDIRNVASNEKYFLDAKDKGNWEPLYEAKKLNFNLGSQFQYSNPAFNGLALIIEKVSGQKWQDFIKENIFEPAGMTESTITDGPEPSSGVCHAYIREGENWIEYDYGEYPTFTAAGNGGVWCSVLDLIKYEKAIRNARFISKEYIDLSRTIFRSDTWASSAPPMLGYSWFIEPADHNQLGVNKYYHTGSQGGFSAFHIAIPEKDITYVALFNRPFEGKDNMMNKVLEILQKYNWGG